MFRSDLLSQAEPFEERTISTCVSCPRLCRHACPVADAEARESTSPHALVVLSDLLRKGRIRAEAEAGLTYHCSDCGACTSACLHGNDVARVLTLARHRLLNEGSSEIISVAKEICGTFGVAGNLQGRSLDRALFDVAHRAGVSLSRDASVIYLPGCTTLESSPDAAVDFLRASSLLGAFDVSLTEVSASCCGLPLYWAGDLEGFRQHARRFSAELGSAKTVVVHDPACAHALSVRYPEVGVRFRPEVVHVARFLMDAHLRVAGAEGGASSSRAYSDVQRPKAHRWHGRLAYADACSASRGLSLSEMPRRLIERVTGQVPLEISPFTGMSTNCCGAGGLLPLTAPETARAMARERLESFAASGADTLVLPSPRCVSHLRSVDDSKNVVDLASLLGRV